MRAFLVISALWLALAPAFAWTRSMTLLGVGKAPSAPALSPVTLTYQTTTVGSTSGSTEIYSFTIGAAAGVNRRVIVSAWSANYVTGNSVTGAVFTPNAGSPVNADMISLAGSDPSGNYLGLALYSAVLPVGTTSTLTVTFNNPVAQPARFSVYTADNSTISSLTPTINYATSSSTPQSLSVSAAAGGAVIAMFVGFGTTGEGWTFNVTSDGTFGSSDWGHANNVSAGSFGVTDTWTGSGATGYLAMWGASLKLQRTRLVDSMVV